MSKISFLILFLTFLCNSSVGFSSDDEMDEWTAGDTDWGLPYIEGTIGSDDEPYNGPDFHRLPDLIFIGENYVAEQWLSFPPEPQVAIAEDDHENTEQQVRASDTGSNTRDFVQPPALTPIVQTGGFQVFRQPPRPILPNPRPAAPARGQQFMLWHYPDLQAIHGSPRLIGGNNQGLPPVQFNLYNPARPQFF